MGCCSQDTGRTNEKSTNIAWWEGSPERSATRFFNDADTDQGAGEVREVGVGAWIQDVGLRAADAELRIQDHGSRTADPAPQIQV